MLFVDKYKPKTLDEVYGQEFAIRELRDFIKNFSREKKKAVLIFGPIGCGKTSSIHALANEINSEILEVNASDTRNKAQIEEVIGNSIKQKSLFNDGKIIFIDEVDALSGMKDRGGIPAILDIIEDTSYPIILTTNDINLEKLDKLKKKTKLVKFDPINNEIIIKVLKNICNKEKIKFKDEDLELLANKSNGDLRASISDLQTLTLDNELKNVEELHDREYLKEINNSLTKIFSGDNILESFQSLDSIKEDMVDLSKFNRAPVIFSNEDSLFYYIEENIPRRYNKDELENAFNYLSKADVYHGRIMRRQYWRFLVYIRTLISSGVTLAGSSNDIKEFKQTRRSPKKNFHLWKLVNKRRRIISSKIASLTHNSTEKVGKDLPFYKLIINKFPIEDLEKEEILWLKQQ